MNIPENRVRNTKKNRQQPKKNPWAWDGPEQYTRVSPGRYEAVPASVQGPEWCSAFQRWSLRIGFNLLDCEGEVSRYFNGGRNKEQWKFGRNSDYFKWWSAANGELPKQGQSMDPRMFFEGQIFTVQVEDAKINAKGAEKHDGEVYSRITQLLAVNGLSIPLLSTQYSSTHPFMHSPIQGGLPSASTETAPLEKCDGCGVKLSAIAMNEHRCVMEKLRPGRAGVKAPMQTQRAEVTASAQASTIH